MTLKPPTGEGYARGYEFTPARRRHWAHCQARGLARMAEQQLRQIAGLSSATPEARKAAREALAQIEIIKAELVTELKGEQE